MDADAVVRVSEVSVVQAKEEAPLLVEALAEHLLVDQVVPGKWGRVVGLKVDRMVGIRLPR